MPNWTLSQKSAFSYDCNLNDCFVLPRPVRYVQQDYFNGVITFDKALETIDCRRESKIDLYFKGVDANKNVRYVRHKASFRGNDVYRARVWNRHKELIDFCDLNKDISYIVPIDDSGFECNVFKLTLTVNPSFWDMDAFNSFSLVSDILFLLIFQSVD